MMDDHSTDTSTLERVVSTCQRYLLDILAQSMPCTRNDTYLPHRDHNLHSGSSLALALSAHSSVESRSRHILHPFQTGPCQSVPPGPAPPLPPKLWLVKHSIGLISSPSISAAPTSLSNVLLSPIPRESISEGWASSSRCTRALFRLFGLLVIDQSFTDSMLSTALKKSLHCFVSEGLWMRLPSLQRLVFEIRSRRNLSGFSALGERRVVPFTVE